MDQGLCIIVTAAGRGYLAENASLDISAGGESPLQAAEKARSMAYEVLRGCGHPMPETIIARIEEDAAVAFVRRPFQRSMLEAAFA